MEQLTLDTIPSLESTGNALENVNANASVFYSKLQHWDEMNLSQGFIDFKRVVKKFSNLPLVIFNQSQVRMLKKLNIIFFDIKNF